MRTRPFETLAQIDDYFAGNLIQCLECGQWFQLLSGKHMRLRHGMTHDEYRQRWGIPKKYGLAGKAIRQQRAEIIRRLVAEGRLTYDHLPGASNPTTRAEGLPRVRAELARQSAMVRNNRPGDHHKIPPGGRRANGRSADRAREYQQAYRAMKAGNSALMAAYKAKYTGESNKESE